MPQEPPDRLDDVGLADAFCRALRAQGERYARMLEIAREQAALLQSAPGDLATDALSLLLGRKQKILADLETAERDLGPLRAEWERRRETVSGPARADVERAVVEVRGVLQDLLGVEEAAHRTAEERKVKASGQIQSLVRGRQVRRAYGTPQEPPGESRFVDKTE